MKIIVFAHGKIKNGPEHILISHYVNRFNKQFNNDFLTSLEISESTEVERQFNQKVSKILNVNQIVAPLQRALKGVYMYPVGYIIYYTHRF